MLGSLGPTELIIILVIVIILFGAGRVGKIAGELGSGIRSFKDALTGDDEEEAEGDQKDKPEES